MSVGGYKSLSTDVFSDITSDNNVENICSEVNAKVPSNFVCLSDCGLFADGLSSIKGMSDSIMGNISSFKNGISEHSENIVLIEDNLKNKNSNLEDIFIFNELNDVPNVESPTIPGSNTASNSLSNNNGADTIENGQDIILGHEYPITKDEMIEKLESELPTPDEYAKMNQAERKKVAENIEMLKKLKGKFFSTIASAQVLKANNGELNQMEGPELSDLQLFVGDVSTDGPNALLEQDSVTKNAQPTNETIIENMEFTTQKNDDKQTASIIEIINLDNKNYINEIYNNEMINDDKSVVNYENDFDDSVIATLIDADNETNKI